MTDVEEKALFSLGEGADIEVIAKLKESGSGSVYVLYDRICGRRLLLKTGSREVLENEAKMLARFAGRGVPEVYLCLERGGQCFLLRRYIEGVSLSEYIESEGPMSPKKAVEIAAELCRIVSRLHSGNPPVIHRDIKCGNVIMDSEGEVFLVDFGISREYDDGSERDTQVLGTPMTAPPEQFGYTQTDERSDVYAIGVLLNELITGSVKVDTSKMPRRVAAVVKRCTEFSPSHRYADAVELEKALSGLYGGKKAGLSRGIKAAAILAVSAAVIAGASLSIPRLVHGSFEEEDTSESLSAAYSFADKAVEREARRLLGKETGDITRADLENITELMLVGEESISNSEDIIIHGATIEVAGTPVKSFGDVSSLEDIANMPNLTTLVLCNQDISDLSPLEGLHPVSLYLHGNRISDLTPLKDMTSLETLYISSNPLGDLSPLSGLFRLTRLGIGATEITDLDDVAKISGLSRLEIHDCPNLEDVSALSEMKSISFLGFRPATSEVIDVISEMTSIQHLYLWEGYSLGNLDRLSKLENLRNLVLDGCAIHSIDNVAEYFPVLVYFTIRYDSVSDLSPLAESESITDVALTACTVKDYGALALMPNLKNVYCTEEQAEEVRKVLAGREDVNIVIEIA